MLHVKPAQEVSIFMLHAHKNQTHCISLSKRNYLFKSPVQPLILNVSDADIRKTKTSGGKSCKWLFRETSAL